MTPVAARVDDGAHRRHHRLGRSAGDGDRSSRVLAWMPLYFAYLRGKGASRSGLAPQVIGLVDVRGDRLPRGLP